MDIFKILGIVVLVSVLLAIVNGNTIIINQPDQPFIQIVENAQ